jgi:hypothetical protein
MPLLDSQQQAPAGKRTPETAASRRNGQQSPPLNVSVSLSLTSAHLDCMLGQSQLHSHLVAMSRSDSYASDDKASKTPVCTTAAVRAIMSALKTFIPRRVDEPTGAFELVSILLILHSCSTLDST